MADTKIISEKILKYYDNASHTAYAEHGGVFADEYDQMVATEGSPLRDLALALQDFCEGKRVLEVAAGHGRWTRYVAGVASYVLATDGSPRMLKQAEDLIYWKKELPVGRCELLCLDAFDIEEAPGSFDVGFSVNWLEHIPRDRVDAFVDALHLKLGSGARVLTAINFFSEKSRAGLFQKDDNPDWLSKRKRPDGSEYEIVDNPYTEADLRQIFNGKVQNLTYQEGVKFYWVTYEIL